MLTPSGNTFERRAVRNRIDDDHVGRRFVACHLPGDIFLSVLLRNCVWDRRSLEPASNAIVVLIVELECGAGGAEMIASVGVPIWSTPVI